MLGTTQPRSQPVPLESWTVEKFEPADRAFVTGGGCCSVGDEGGGGESVDVGRCGILGVVGSVGMVLVLILIFYSI